MLRTTGPALLAASLFAVGAVNGAEAGEPARPGSDAKTVRVAAVQAQRRLIDWRLTKPAEVLAAVDRNLEELERIVHRAGERKCDVLAFPEDTLGLLNWYGMNEAVAKEVLPQAVKRMLDRLGRAAASHRMYLVVCSDFVEADGATYNTAFFLGRDGKEIGRYHKTCPTWSESGSRQRGKAFPVFPTPDLGTVGLTICYDLVFPETARCLALQGADLIFFPTMGTAAVGDGDIGVQALRVRAAENHVWLVVAHRGGGAMIISPRGKIIAQGEGPDGLALADLDPFGGREGGDAANYQKDMRARLFRERNPEAFGILTDPRPPALAKVPIDITREEAGRISARMLTVGEEAFRQADALARAGKTTEALAAFEKLRAEYRGSWIDRVAEERLRKLRTPAKEEHGSRPEKPAGIAAKYPGDKGIARDPRVLFAEDFETGGLEEVGKRWSAVSNQGGKVLAFCDDSPPGSAGRRSLRVTATPGENTGGHLYKRLPRGVEKLHARFYVKFPEDAGYVHHFVALGGYNPPTDWPQGGAGERPRGDDRLYVGIEPHGDYGRFQPPGAWSFYDYWHEMKQSADGKYWGNAIRPETPLPVPKGRWQCVEVMVKLNAAPDTADGELTLWLDGKRVMHVTTGTPRGPWSGMGFQLPTRGGTPFEGFRWRTSRDLQLNWFWLLHYVTEHAARQNRVDTPKHSSPVFFDDIVLATEYIGPLRREAPGG
jgi:predicted amidohydrolase